MKQTVYSMLGALAMLSTSVWTPALALTVDDFKVITTHDLVRLCGTDATDPLYDAARGFCLGYIDGAWDYHAALSGKNKGKPLACPAPTITRDDVVAVLLEWAKTHPDLLDGEDPVEGVMRAVSYKWPCPNDL